MKFKGKKLWEKMRTLKVSITPSPLLVLGDFNVIYKMEETSDYFQGMPIPSKVQEFQTSVESTDLVDVHGKGFFFTWSNKGLYL